MQDMLLIGSRLNSSREQIRRILESRDEQAVLSIAREQVECGASALDICVSSFGAKEQETLEWAARTIIERIGIPIFFDSSNEELLLRMASKFEKHCVVNSISCKTEKLDKKLYRIAECHAGVVLMLSSWKEGCFSIEENLQSAREIAEITKKAGIERSAVFIDPATSSLACSPDGVVRVLETLRELSKRLPEHRSIVGLANASFGLPERKLIDRAFAAMLVTAGASALICDTTDRELMGTIAAALALAGRDKGCRSYLDLHRKHLRKE